MSKSTPSLCGGTGDHKAQSEGGCRWVTRPTGRWLREDPTSRCVGTWGEQCGRGSQSGGGGRDELSAGADG